MKKTCAAVVISMLVIVATTGLFACSEDWQSKYQTELPTLQEQDGWEQTLFTDFSQYENIETLLQQSPWTSVNHGKRATEYWCDKQLEITDDGLVVHSAYETDHDCEVCQTAEGVFTGGIDTRVTDGNEGFQQTFGYYEARVKVPDAPGMWSAFWLQSDNMGNIGHKGVDGSEIDVYESSFHQKNRSMTGNAIHYDGYDQFHVCKDHVQDVGYDLYDGQYHTYALHWTPQYYVFYVDGKAVWATDAGGVSTVPTFMKLTVEVRDATYGPYGQRIGTFENRSDGTTDFIVDYVKVYQNQSYVPYANTFDAFDNLNDQYQTKRIVGIIAAVLGAVALVGSIAIIIVHRRRKKANNA